MPEEQKSSEGSPPAKKEGGNKKKEHGGNAKGFAPRAPKFEGKCDELKGHIYDASIGMVETFVLLSKTFDCQPLWSPTIHQKTLVVLLSGFGKRV